MTHDTRDAPLSRSSTEAHDRASSRTQLRDKSLLLSVRGEDTAESVRPDLGPLRALGEEIEGGGTAVQSVAVAAVQIIERALCFEREAADAALSLGQQEKLQSMVETAEEAVSILRTTLSASGGKVVQLCAEGSSPVPADGQPWWFALTDALEVLEEGTHRMESLTTAQPAGSPARELSRQIASLLSGHHDALLLEAEQWIG